MKNQLIKLLSENQEAVIYILDATDLVQGSMERVQSFPPATKHLGQAMMATVLLQSLSDADRQENLSLQWMCPGPFGHCFAEAKNFGEVRGTIQYPQAPITDYATGLGTGLLQVRRTVAGFTTTSVVNSVGDICTDIVEYLEKSEQKNCGINLSVSIDWADPDKQDEFKVTSALGYMVHILPQPTEQKFNDALVRWNRQMETLGPISRWILRKNQILNDMAMLISGEEKPKISMSQRVDFFCNCSEQRALRALALLEEQEKQEGSIPQEQETEIRCEYCGKMYHLTPKRKKRANKKN